MTRGGHNGARIMGTGVRVAAWVWTRLMTERMRVATMWWLNEKVVVRVVAVVPGPHGSLLARVRNGRLALPSVRLGRASQPADEIGSHLRVTCGLAADAWLPVDAVRGRGRALEAILLAAGVRATGTRADGDVAWVGSPSTVHADAPAWLSGRAR